tara:strand:+ start:684 stop:2777 length:2094 start_codon:yes stop_codon:yes gene_type:complete
LAYDTDLWNAIEGTGFLAGDVTESPEQITGWFSQTMQDRGAKNALQNLRELYGSGGQRTQGYQDQLAANAGNQSWINDYAQQRNQANASYFQGIDDDRMAAGIPNSAGVAGADQNSLANDPQASAWMQSIMGQDLSTNQYAPEPVDNRAWNENQDFLSWVPQQDWFSFMDQNASPDAVLNQLQSSYNTQGAGAQDIINEAYQVFQQGGGTPREAQSYQNMMQRPTLPQFTPLYNQNDTWGEAEFNPFDNPWDFDYYISQQGLLDAPTGPRPGSGAYMYAEDPNSIFSQEDQAAYQDYLGQLQAYQSQPPQQAAAQQAIAPTQQQAPAQQALAQQAPAQQAAIPAQQQVSAQQQAAAQQFNPSTDFSLQTSGGFPTRNGIQTGYWDDNDQYNLPPVDYSMLGQFAGDAPPAIPEMDPGDMPSIIGGQAQINLGNQMADFATPNIQRDIPGTPWEDSFMNFMDNPMDGDGSGTSALDQLIAGNYSWDQAGTDFGDYLSGIGGDVSSFFGEATGNLIGTDASNANDFFGTSLSQTGGKLAGLAGLFSPIGTLAEAGFGLTDRANLNDQLSQLGIDGLSWGDTLGAAINPFMDQRDYAMDKIYNTMNSGAGVNSDNYGGAESVASSFMGANPLSQGGNIDLSQLDVGAMMAKTSPASGIPVPEFNYVPGSALTQPVQEWAWNPTPSMQPSSYGWGFHPGNR